MKLNFFYSFLNISLFHSQTFHYSFSNISSFILKHFYSFLKHFIMKNLKILTFGILLVGMASCKKDVDQQLQKSANPQLQQDALAENKGKLFEKSITVYNADK